jgi:uncharacterized Zn-binding protein involved in type VI secretion
MSGKPAAYLTSGTQHTPILGVGSPDVVIHGLPAWSSELISLCPIHGPEAVGMGSETVLINKKRAARAGDFLQGAGAPNQIMVGATDVLIGTPDMGTASAAAEAAFCKAYCALVHDWGSLTPAQREQRYNAILAQSFGVFGAPPPTAAATSAPPADASWNRDAWQINVAKGAWDDPHGPPSGRATLHEIRHGEQTYMGMRANGGPGNATVPANVAAAAASQPLDPNSPEGRYGRLQADNELTPAGLDNRNKIIQEINASYAAGGVSSARYAAAVQAYYDQPGGADAQTVEQPGQCGGCP